MRTLLTGLALVAGLVFIVGEAGAGSAASETRAAPVSGLRLFTSHGTFTSPAPISSTETTSYGSVSGDGMLDPKAPPVRLHLGESVRFSLPAIRGGQPPLQYDAVRLDYRDTVRVLDVAKPIWRPDKEGTYLLGVSLHATWQTAVDSGTRQTGWLQTGWLIKIRVKR